MQLNMIARRVALMRIKPERGCQARSLRAAYCPGTPIETGRTGEPEPPFDRSGRMMVQDSQTLSFASSPRLAFWI